MWVKTLSDDSSSQQWGLLCRSSLLSWGPRHLGEETSPCHALSEFLTHTICELNKVVVLCHYALGMPYHVQRFIMKEKKLEQQMWTDRKEDQLYKKIWNYIFFDCLSLVWEKLLSWGTKEIIILFWLLRISILSTVTVIENVLVIWNLSSPKSIWVRHHSRVDFQHGANIPMMLFKVVHEPISVYFPWCMVYNKYSVTLQNDWQGPRRQGEIFQTKQRDHGE